MKKIQYIIMGFIGLMGCTENVSDAKQEAALPHIYPDYIGVTIPVNIAPLNFSMADEPMVNVQSTMVNGQSSMFNGQCQRIDAVITDSHGHSLHSQGNESVDFDLDDWHALLGENSGDSLTVTVSAKYDDGWHTYRPFSIYVSPDSIDYGLCYRLIAPGYEVWSKMGIYERDLSTFDERALIENTQFEGCVNCHSFNRGNPADMSLHIRGPHGATLLRHSTSSSIPPSETQPTPSSTPSSERRKAPSSPLLSERRKALSSIPPSERRAIPLTAYNTKTPQTLGLCVYPYWHPSGRYIAYSTNATSQLFHSAGRTSTPRSQGENRIEVFDTVSDLQVYDVETNELLLSPLLKQDSVYETFPVFSADGRSLYFCAAAVSEKGIANTPAEGNATADSSLFTFHSSLNSIHYNLCRIDFDPATGTFGNRIDTIVDAASFTPSSGGSRGGGSISFPRPSYDGRFLCYTLSDFGQFSIWHHEADLYLLDLATGESRPMTEANSDDTESFHNWSANSRWLVFSSRRDDGLFTRPYFCHVNADGHVSKPFMLPQRNPLRFYRDRFLSFNVPEFIICPTDFDGRQAARLINDDERRNFGVRPGQ